MKFLKFCLVILITLITLSYYRVVSFEHGFIHKEKEFTLEESIKKKNYEYIKNPFDDEEFLVTYEIEDKIYFTKMDENELKALDLGLSIVDDKLEEKSIVPAIVGLTADLIVILFVRKKN